jgi:hypothetical protein
VPPIPRLIGSVPGNVENTPPNAGSGDYMEVYDLTREDGHGGYSANQDQDDEELAMALELSRKEF